MSELSVSAELARVAVLAEERDELAASAALAVGDIGQREHLLARKAAVEAELERMRADFMERRMAGLAGVVAARSAEVAGRLGAVVSGSESENHTPNL